MEIKEGQKMEGIKEKRKIKKILVTYLLKNRWMVTFVIMAVATVLVFVLFRYGITRGKELEHLYYASQTVAAAFVSAGVLIAGWQYVITARAEMSSVAINQMQKAIDLAAFYKDNILKPYKAVRYVFEQAEILQVMSCVKYESMNNFDVYELDKLMSEKQQVELKTIQNSKKFTESVLKANDIYDLHLHIESRQENDGIEEKKALSDFEAQISSTFMNSIVTNMLNDMEYFAMHFSHETADDTVVYQSLHQSYLEIVHTVYYCIANVNKQGQSQYYTNLTELYKKWYAKQQVQLEEIANGSRRSQCKGNTVSQAV